MALIVILYTCIKILRFNTCYIKSNVKTLEPLDIFGWDIHFVSIVLGAQLAIILLAFGSCVVIFDYWDMLYLGRAPSSKETLPDFCEWCRVTRPPRVFHGLTSLQLTHRFWGVTAWYRAKVKDYFGSSVGVELR